MPDEPTIPDGCSYDEAKALALTVVAYCQKHQQMIVKEVTTNPSTGKWCSVSYCPECRAKDGIVTMEFQPVEEGDAQTFAE